MRNLISNPINADEAIFALQIAHERYARDVKIHGTGDTDGLAILMAEKFIESNKEEFDKFTKKELFKVLR